MVPHNRLAVALASVALALAAAAGCTSPASPSSSSPAAGGSGPAPDRSGGSGGTSSREPGNMTPAPAGPSPTGGSTGEGGTSADTGASESADAAPTPPAPTGAPSATIVVSAGKHDRQNTVVSFQLDGVTAGQSFTLEPPSGPALPLQVDATGKAVFVLPLLAAGADLSLLLVRAPASPPPAVQAVREADGVKLTMGAATILRYQTQGKLPPGIGNNYKRGGYLHPIFTPAGALVTDDYPGDHRHHHGLWSAWAKSDFEGHMIDFWNMGGGSAKVDFDALDSTWEGPVHGGLKTRQVHVVLAGGAPKVALHETWEITAYAMPGAPAPYFVFDLDSTQEAASASPLMLHQYIYGGFALRGHASWGGAGGAVFLTSEGKTRGNGDGTSARWCFIGGKVDGNMAGYAALIHPSNFRAPQPVRINPTDPFFSIAPVRDSGFDITQGKPYRSRFRIVVSDGAPDATLLERLWQDYAEPPTITVKPAP